jgi:hypothetical protein
VSVPVNHPSEINEIFDDISYDKGGSLIRMMANFLDVDVFNRGIEHYLRRHKFGNAKQVLLYFFEIIFDDILQCWGTYNLIRFTRNTNQFLTF